MALMSNDVDWVVFFALFSAYGMLNILFDVFTVEQVYESNQSKHSENLGYQAWCITNKKYFPQTVRVPRTDNTTFATHSSYKPRSIISFVVHFYNGQSPFLHFVLHAIYLLGITKKNFVVDPSSLKNEIHSNAPKVELREITQNGSTISNPLFIDIEGLEPDVRPTYPLTFGH